MKRRPGFSFNLARGVRVGWTVGGRGPWFMVRPRRWFK